MNEIVFLLLFWAKIPLTPAYRQAGFPSPQGACVVTASRGGEGGGKGEEIVVGMGSHEEEKISQQDSSVKEVTKN